MKHKTILAVSFLKTLGVRGLLHKGDWPKYSNQVLYWSCLFHVPVRVAISSRVITPHKPQPRMIPRLVWQGIGRRFLKRVAHPNLDSAILSAAFWSFI